jgi:uncharacterized protein
MGIGREPEISVLWHCARLASSDYASLRRVGDRFHLQGVAVLPLGDAPCRIDYHVLVDRAWLPLSTEATITTPEGVQVMALVSDGAGRWTFNGEPVATLNGCRDLDLGWTPATNTIPIRRLDLQVGEQATIAAGWIRFPELDVVRSDQQYERLAADHWRYRSGPYDFELVTDPASGLVLTYGEDLWRAVATAVT